MSTISIHVSLLIALFAILAALPEAQAETTDRRVRIAKDVPTMRVDYVSVGDMLLGVWPVFGSGQCYPDRREMNRWLLTNRFAIEVRSINKL